MPVGTFFKLTVVKLPILDAAKSFCHTKSVTLDIILGCFSEPLHQCHTRGLPGKGQRNPNLLYYTHTHTHAAMLCIIELQGLGAWFSACTTDSPPALSVANMLITFAGPSARVSSPPTGATLVFMVCRCATAWHWLDHWVGEKWVACGEKWGGVLLERKQGRKRVGLMMLRFARSQASVLGPVAWLGSSWFYGKLRVAAEIRKPHCRATDLTQRARDESPLYPCSHWQLSSSAQDTTVVLPLDTMVVQCCGSAGSLGLCCPLLIRDKKNCTVTAILYLSLKKNNCSFVLTGSLSFGLFPHPKTQPEEMSLLST